MNFWQFVDKHPVATVIGIVLILLAVSDCISAARGCR